MGEKRARPLSEIRERNEGNKNDHGGRHDNNEMSRGSSASGTGFKVFGLSDQVYRGIVKMGFRVSERLALLSAVVATSIAYVTS
jgi:hypothetical protein